MAVALEEVSPHETTAQLDFASNGTASTGSAFAVVLPKRCAFLLAALQCVPMYLPWNPLYRFYREFHPPEQYSKSVLT